MFGVASNSRDAGPLRIRNVSVLSTFFENVGDDLAREGVLHQIEHFLDRRLSFRFLTKSNRLSRFLPVSRTAHSPVQRMDSVRRQRTRFAGRFLARIPPARHFDKVAKCDLFVIAGTPVFYFFGEHNFLKNERKYGDDWPGEVFDKGLNRSGNPPLAALGIGSIMDAAPGKTLQRHPDAKEFLRRFLHRAAVVTVRDAATESLLHAACPERQHIVHRTLCPSLWAGTALGVTPPLEPEGGRALLGFSLESAGWGTRDDAIAVRRRTARWLIKSLRRRDISIQLVAHNGLDVAAQLELAREQNLPEPLVLDSRGLLEESAKSLLSVTWRVHGSMAALSMGTPVLLFRSDSRYRMAEALGATILDDDGLTPERLESVLEEVCADLPAQRMERYTSLMRRLDTETRRLSNRFRSAFSA